MHIFTKHPASIGESYGEHLRAAFGLGMAMIGAGFCCLVHAIVPALFVRTGSEAIEDLHRRMKKRLPQDDR
jgi:hypothetical protein